MHITTVVLTFVVLFYVYVGGYVQDQSCRATFCIDTLLADDNICVSADELKLFTEAAIAAYDAGVTATTETSVSNWEYGPAVFFTITVVTSIGMSRHIFLLKC